MDKVSYNLDAYGMLVEKRLRASKLTTYQFGKLLGLSSSQVSDIIDGKILPIESLANEIKMALGVELEAFKWNPINPKKSFNSAKLFNLDDFRKG